MEVRHPDLAHQFQRCLSGFADKVAYSIPYNQPGWIPQDNSSQLISFFELQDLCPRPWRYRTAENLSTLSVLGLQSSYGGGGFVADLGYNARSALNVLGDLERNNWINDLTAAVFVEFTVHQPATALFSVAKYLFERLPTGGYNTGAKVTTLTLYASPDPTFKSFYQLCQLLLMLIILFFFFAEIGKLYRQKCAYFTQFWNWVELFQIFGTIAAIVMFFFKEMYTSMFVERVQANPFETSSTDYIVLWSDLEIFLLAFVIFIVTMKFLRLIRFNRHICQMIATIQKSIDHLVSFFFVFVGIILAYTQLGVLVFGANVPAYSSFFQAMRAVCQMILGGATHFHELRDTSRFVGPLFVFCYMLSMSMIMLNMFLAILNDSYEEVKDIEGDSFADAELGEFMKNYITTKAGYLGKDLVGFFKKMLNLTRFRGKPRRTYNSKSYVKVPTRATDVFASDEADDIIEICDETPPLAMIASMEDLSDSDDDAVTASLEDIRRSLSNISAELRCSITVLDNIPPRSREKGFNDLNKDLQCSCEETVLDPGSYGYNRYSYFRSICERSGDSNTRLHSETRITDAHPLLSNKSTDHLNVLNIAISSSQSNNYTYVPTIWERRGDLEDRFRKRKSTVQPLLDDSTPGHFEEDILEGRKENGPFERILLQKESTPDLMSTSTTNSSLVDDLPESLV